MPSSHVRDVLLDRPASTRSLDVVLAVIIGVAVGAAIVVAAAGSSKALVVIAGALIAGAAWMVLSLSPSAVVVAAWVALASTLSLSIKFHPVFRADHLGGAIGLRVSVTELLLVTALTTMWLHGTTVAGRVIRYPRGIALAAAAYLGCAAWSTLASRDIPLGSYQILATLQALAVGLVFANVRRGTRLAHAVTIGLLLGLCLQGMVAALQAYRPGAVSMAAVGMLTDTQADTIDEALPDVDLGTTTIGGDVVLRPTGLLIHPNVLGAYLVLTLPLAAAVWLTTRSRLELGLATMALTCGGVALYASLSRSAWLGTGLAAIVLAAAGWRTALAHVPRRRLVVAVLLALCVGGMLLGRAERIYLRLTETAGEAIDFRRDLAATAWDMAAAHPWTGVGLNTFVHEVAAFDATGNSRLRAFPVHNVYMLELAETGIPGGIAFACLVAAVLGTLSGVLRTASGRSRFVALGLVAGLVGFWASQMVDYIYRIPVLTTLVWAHVGFALSLLEPERDA